MAFMQAAEFTTYALLKGQGIFLRLEKGDRPGHEFYGNQYTSRGMSIKAQALAADVMLNKRGPMEAAKIHDELALLHLDHARDIEARIRNPRDPKDSENRRIIASAHYDAANAHGRAAAMLRGEPVIGERTTPAEASQRAASASVKADRAEKNGLETTLPIAV